MRWRLVAGVVGGVVVLVVGGLAVAIATVDLDSYKPQIVDAAKQATGRDLQINGHIGLGFSLSPTVEVRDVVFANPSGYSRPAMATLERIELKLGLLPLLSKRVEIDRLILVKPDIMLETDAKGQPNWVFAPPAAPPAPAPALTATAATAPPSGGSPAMALGIQTVRLEDGAFAYRDGQTGQTSTLTIKEIAVVADSPNAPLHLTADFALDGTGVSLVADSGPVSALLASGGAPWPVKLAVSTSGARIGVDGSIANPAAGQGIDLALSADIPDFTALAPLAKQDLPAVKAFVFSGRIKDDPKGPAAGLALSALKMTSSVGDLAGALAIAFGDTMGVTGALTSDKLDIDAIVKSVPADKAGSAKGATAPAKGAAAPAPAAKSKYLVPDEPMPLGVLKTVAADVQTKIGALRFGGADYKQIDTHLVLKDGDLTLDPFSGDLPQGHVAVTLTAGASKAAMPVHATLRSPGIALQGLLKALGQPDYVTGNLEIQSDLRGTGETPHAIAASLDGTLGLAVAGGTLDIKRLGGSAASILQTLNPTTSAGAANALRCFAVRLEFNKGVGTFKALAIGSTLLNVEGSGTIDMRNETLNLDLRSHTVIAGASVTAPVKVFGPLAAPQTKVDEVGAASANAGALAGSFGSLLGAPKGSSGSGDACPGALALARGQAAPAAEAPGAAPANPPAAAAAPAAKPSAVGGALKQLFH